MLWLFFEVAQGTRLRILDDPTDGTILANAFTFPPVFLRMSEIYLQKSDSSLI